MDFYKVGRITPTSLVYWNILKLKGSAQVLPEVETCAQLCLKPRCYPGWEGGLAHLVWGYVIC